MASIVNIILKIAHCKSYKENLTKVLPKVGFLFRKCKPKAKEMTEEPVRNRTKIVLKANIGHRYVFQLSRKQAKAENRICNFTRWTIVFLTFRLYFHGMEKLLHLRFW